MGDTVKVTDASGAQAAKVTVLGIYRDPMLFNGVIVSDRLFAVLDLPTDPQVTMAKAAPGTDPDALQTDVESALKPTSRRRRSTPQQGYIDHVTSRSTSCS